MPAKDNKNDKDKEKRAPQVPATPEDWELEKVFDADATLEGLLTAPPFRQSADDKGHSETVGARVPGWMLRRITKFKEMSGGPYDVTSDVVRDAIYIGLTIISMRYKHTSDWRTETKMQSTINTASAGKHIEDQVNELIGGLDDLIYNDEKKKAAEKLEEYVKAALDLEDDWHKNRLFKILRQSKTVQRLSEECSELVQAAILQGRRKRE